MKNAEDPVITHKQHAWQGMNILSEQESDKDILGLKSWIKNGSATILEQKN